MLLEKGMAALNLEMTERVYRTEYSVLGHTKLIEKVTGIDLSHEPSPETVLAAQNKFARAWDMCFNWCTLIGADYLGKFRTSMGHAVYAEKGADWNDDIHAAFTDEEDAFNFDPCELLPNLSETEIVDGFERNYRNNCRAFPDMVNMTGIYITCMSGMIDLLGWDILLTCAGVDAKRFGELVERYSRWIERYFVALAKSDVPVVMVHDDIVWTEGAFISPAWYRKYIFPAYKRCFRHLNDAGKKLIFTSDGNYTEFIDDIAACDVDGFVMEPCTDIEYIARKYGRTHSFIGNADTRVLLMGDKDDIRREVKRCMDIGREYPGFIMAVGNHIPSNTPVDNCLYYDEFCKEFGRR